MPDPLSSTAPLPYAHGEPAARGVLRSTPEDFRVDEIMEITPSGAGEHILLQVQKREANTPWVARQIARFAGVRPRDVSYAGLKDRRAVTTQWFSVHLPGKQEPRWADLTSDDLRILSAQRHHRKLRIGALAGNRFQIVLRELSAERQDLEQRLAAIAGAGVPNYFGEQRFGHDNIGRAIAMLKGVYKVQDHAQRSIYLSALRSDLFNQVLSMRVQHACWNSAVNGDVLMLQGTHSVFIADEIDETLQQRLAAHDIHPTGPLWGKDGVQARGLARDYEQTALAPRLEHCQLLEQAGLVMARRPLRIRPAELSWRWQADDVLECCFALPAGAYATTLLRELLNFAGEADRSDS